jgi:hypothetical protein
MADVPGAGFAPSGGMVALRHLESRVVSGSDADSLAENLNALWAEKDGQQTLIAIHQVASFQVVVTFTRVG